MAGRCHLPKVRGRGGGEPRRVWKRSLRHTRDVRSAWFSQISSETLKGAFSWRLSVEFSYLSLLCLQPSVYTYTLPPHLICWCLSALYTLRAVTRRPPAKTEASPTAAAAADDDFLSGTTKSEIFCKQNVTLWRHLQNHPPIQALFSLHLTIYPHCYCTGRERWFRSGC